jgi:hypothetical protein
MKITDVINNTADQTARAVVRELKRAGIVKENKLGSFKKVERSLYEFYEWKDRDDIGDETKKFCALVERAFDRVRDDKYFMLIPLKYGERWTHERIAEYFDVDVSVISKRRTKLINQLRPVIFSDDFIIELYGE